MPSKETVSLSQKELEKSIKYGGADAQKREELTPKNSPYFDDPNHLMRSIKNGSTNHKKHLDRINGNGQKPIETEQFVYDPTLVFIKRRRNGKKPRS